MRQHPARPSGPSKGWVEARYVGLVGPIMVVAAGVGVWQIVAVVLRNRVLVPPPVDVVLGGVWLASNNVLGPALLVSVQEMYLGMAIGIVAGIVFGIAIGRYRFLDVMLGPFVDAGNATPSIVFIPLLVIWLGVGIEARVALIVIITFWPVLLNTAAGTRNINSRYMDLGTSFGLSEGALVWKVALPAVMPYIMTGLRLAVGLGVVGMIISEMEVSEVGLGNALIFYGDAFETARLIALVFIVALFGVAHVLILRAIQSRWIPWSLA